jgi:hypothetical protein
MEWTVIWRSGAGVLSCSITSANGREHERDTGRSESVPAPFEMRL